MANKLYGGNKEDQSLQFNQFLQSVSADLPLITIQHVYSPITVSANDMVSVEDMEKKLAN